MSSKQLYRKKAKQEEEERESSSEDDTSDEERAASKSAAKKAAAAGASSSGDDGSAQVPKEKDDHFVKRLSKWKALKVKSFKGKKYIDFREYYEKEGKLLPGKKGLMLNEDEWKVVVQNLTAINDAFNEA